MLSNIIRFYFPQRLVSEISPFGNGHINNTYLVRLHGEKPAFILQRINTQAFPDPLGIAETHVKLEEAVFKTKEQLTIARLIRTADGKKIHIDEEGNYWRLTTYIPDSYSLEMNVDKHHAFEAGNAFGWFARSCHKLDPADFKEPIKDFHCLNFRVKQLELAVRNDIADRLKEVENLVLFYLEYGKNFLDIESLINSGQIPLRIVHNDTKTNNLLFRDNKAVAVIDLDTVGPGILFYDYGDALRTCANIAKEDEEDLNKVGFNIETFEAFTHGYMRQVRSIVNSKEEELFYKAPFLMTYIMGIRFLTDYLKGDIYYKISYGQHNLTRSMVQKTLIDHMENKKPMIIRMIRNSLKVVPVFE